MTRPTSSDRTVVAGFAGLLILMSGLATDSAMQIRSVSETTAYLRREIRDRDAILDQLRTDIYRSATVARDYLLEHDKTRASAMTRELESLRAHVEEELLRYERTAPAEEMEAVRSLHEHSDLYWESLAPLLGWTRSAERQQRQGYLQSTIVPRRDEVVQFVRQAGLIDERMLDAGEARQLTVQSRFQHRVVTLSVLGLILGGVLATVVVRKVHRLGKQAESHLSEVLSAREDLKRLSDRLRAVQEEERLRLSRELHDDLGQSMSAMLIELGKIEAVPVVRTKCADELTSVRHLAEENVVKVRNMALLLRPAMLDELGLVPALRWHAKEVARRTGLKVKVIAADTQDQLPESHRTCIYRLVQEALNNCVRHANAKEARVILQVDERGLSVSVQDDGTGFDPERHRGLGLLGMSERVRAVSGRFHVQSQPGEGTVVSAYFPLEGERIAAREESVA